MSKVKWTLHFNYDKGLLCSTWREKPRHEGKSFNYVYNDGMGSWLCDECYKKEVLEDMSEYEGKYDNLIANIVGALRVSEPITTEFIKEALQDIVLFDRKQHDYGSENISAFGELGVLVRANDKIARLKNLQGKEAKNESIEDAWRDLSVYGVIARLVRRGVWK